MAKQSVNVLTLGKTPLTTILKLAWPTIIEQMMFTVLNFSDTAMVGVLGAVATAAVGITSTTIWLSGSVISCRQRRSFHPAGSINRRPEIISAPGGCGPVPADQPGSRRRIGPCVFLSALEPPRLAWGGRGGRAPCAGLSAGDCSFPSIQYAFVCFFFPAALHGRYAHTAEV